MSIYEHRTGLMDYEDVHEPLVASNAQVSPGDSFAESRDWLRHRKAKPIDRLLPITGRWFDRLPLGVFPSELAAQYPRIINLIALQWNRSDACFAYFDELLFDRRGARQGFPAGVQRELLRLREHWYSRERMPKA